MSVRGRALVGVVAAAVLALQAVGCGPGVQSRPGEDVETAVPLALGALEDVEVVPGTVSRVKVVVLRPEGTGPTVQLQAEGLPTWGSLQGDTLVFSPGLAEEGEALVTVVASDGTSTAREALRVRAPRRNAAPTLGILYLNDPGLVGYNVPFGPATTYGALVLQASGVRDGDGDGVRLVAEVVLEAQAFTGTATHRGALVKDRDSNGDLSLLRVALDGLSEGSYRVQVWAEDERGATSERLDAGRMRHAPRPERSSAPDLRTCGAESVDVTSSAEHCGACGRSCGGALCERGLCVPTRLAEAPGDDSPGGRSVTELALAGDWVLVGSAVWPGEGHGVWRVRRAGGPLERVWNDWFSGGLAVDGDVFYTGLVHGGGMEQVSLDGFTTRRLPANYEECRTSYVTHMTGHAGALWWLAFPGPPLMPQLCRISMDGASFPEARAQLPLFGDDLAVDDSGAYVVIGQYGWLYRVPLGGGTPVQLATGLFGARALALDDAFVYAAWDSGPQCSGCVPETTLVRVPKAGGAAEVLGTAHARVAMLALDGDWLYWTHRGPTSNLPLSDGSVMRMPKGGGSREVVADGFTDVHSLVLDATHLYFAPASDGVYRLPK